jgi:hypothetical protein
VAQDRDLRRLAAESLSASWLSSRFGIQPARIDALRREGSLFGVRLPGAREHLYPAWQFARGSAETKPEVRRVLTAAREAGLSEIELFRLLERREGLGRERLVDALRAGRVDFVVAQIAAATRAA